MNRSKDELVESFPVALHDDVRTAPSKLPEDRCSQNGNFSPCISERNPFRYRVDFAKTESLHAELYKIEVRVNGKRGAVRTLEKVREAISNMP
jgi:hypothetical protein